MNFEWDEGKNASNFRKHSIWFEEAQTVWADAASVEFFDSDHSKEYDLKKLKKRPGPVKTDPDAARIPTSIRIDGSDLASLRTEAERMGIPYQTLIGSILHRYVTGELLDRKAAEALSQRKTA